MLSPAPIALLPEVLITGQSIRHGLGVEGLSGMMSSAPASGATGLTNSCWYWPIYMDVPGLVTKFWTTSGATISGNLDIGLYNNFAKGDFTKIITVGSTAQAAGANAMQEYDPTDFWLTRGVYFMGCAYSSSTATFLRPGLNAISFASAMGVLYQASTFPLPATATPVQAVGTPAPWLCGFAFRALVA